MYNRVAAATTAKPLVSAVGYRSVYLTRNDWVTLVFVCVQLSSRLPRANSTAYHSRLESVCFVTAVPRHTLDRLLRRHNLLLRLS